MRFAFCWHYGEQQEFTHLTDRQADGPLFPRNKREAHLLLSCGIVMSQDHVWLKAVCVARFVFQEIKGENLSKGSENWIHRRF